MLWPSPNSPGVSLRPSSGLLTPCVPFDPPSTMRKTSGNTPTLLLTGPPSSFCATSTTRKSCLPKNYYSSLLSSVSDTPWQTINKLRLFLSPATLLHHLHTHLLLLLPWFLFSLLLWNLKFTRSCQTVQTSSLIQIPSHLASQRSSSVLIPTITNIVNLSLISSLFHLTLKEPVISTLLKKPTWIKGNSTTTGPICNFSLVSKIIEHVVKSRLMDHLTSYSLLNSHQSAYCKQLFVHPQSPCQCSRITETIMSWLLCCFWHYWPWHLDHPQSSLSFWLGKK